MQLRRCPHDYWTGCSGARDRETKTEKESFASKLGASAGREIDGSYTVCSERLPERRFWRKFWPTLTVPRRGLLSTPRSPRAGFIVTEWTASVGVFARMRCGRLQQLSLFFRLSSFSAFALLPPLLFRSIPLPLPPFSVARPPPLTRQLVTPRAFPSVPLDSNTHYSLSRHSQSPAIPRTSP